MAVRRLYIPNVEEFFDDFLQLIQRCNECLQGGANGGLAEFLGRRLDEYQRSLRVMYGHLRDFRNNSPDLLNDFEHLLNMVGQIKNSLESLYSDGNVGELPVNDALCTTVNDGFVGRPRFEFTQEQIQMLRHRLGFRWVDIATILGISSRTLSRRRQEFGMPVGQNYNFSSISSDELDRLVREILTTTPQSGLYLIIGALRSRGIYVQRRRVIETLHRLDPVTSALRQSRTIIRRAYSVPGPNSLW